MDKEDQNDIIKKVESAGSNDSDNNQQSDNQEVSNNNNEQPSDNQQDNNEQPDLNENNFILQNPKKLSIFAPKGSKEHMETNDIKETIKNRLKEEFIRKSELDSLTIENNQLNIKTSSEFKTNPTLGMQQREKEMNENNIQIQEPEVKPTETKPVTKPKVEPLRRDKPFLPNIKPGIEVDPKANKTDLIDETATKKNFEIYHDTFSSAVQEAEKYVQLRGFTIDENEWFNQVATGPKKPDAGKTNRYSVSLIANGKPSNKILNMQVYNMGNRYELNCYIA